MSAGRPGGPGPALATAALFGAVAWELFAATTFTGDDHLFLTFARLAPGPLAPFFSDQHGGEYYRPLPMALWWLLARLGGGAEWPFAALALALHTTTAALLAALVRATGRGATAAALAAALFFAAPTTRETAWWFSASTDLLATAGTLAALVCLSRGTGRATAASLLFAAVAYLSKESALALPLLAAAFCWITGRSRRPLGAHLALAALVVAVRTVVLRGPGGSGDPRAGVGVRSLQIAAGLMRGLLGDSLLPGAVAVVVGGAVLAWAAWGAAREGRKERAALLPLLWVAITALPLLAAGWVVGARYFYLPSVGLAWLVAERLCRRDPLAIVTALVVLLALGSVAALGRRADVVAYRARLGAAAQAVTAETAGGHRIVHVRCGIKDLDLALKNRLSPGGDQAWLVLSDVPASFVVMPESLARRTDFLRARPPLPPSGAYRFGDRLVVGLARREESPDLEDVVARLPEIRFVEVRDGGSGGAFWREVTGR